MNSIKSITVYEVGGSVRDRILDIPHHDHDYAVEAPSFEAMKQYLVDQGYVIYVEKEEYGTIKAKKPTQRKSCDFTLCRRDGYYSDNRRPDTVHPGTIYEDLARRDFTINAIAVDPDGNFLDPHNGKEDLNNRIIKCIGNPRNTILEDPLRLLRAFRFAVTKGFRIDAHITELVYDKEFQKRFESSVSIERIQVELNKMLVHDPIRSIKVLYALPTDFLNIIFKNKGLKLTTTMKNKISIKSIK